MARHHRLILPDYPHHVTARGNHQSSLFFSDADRRDYLRLLNRAAERAGVDIHAYCLMPNHVHLIAVPESAQSFSRLFHGFHSHYGRLVNESLNRKGHLFESR